MLLVTLDIPARHKDALISAMHDLGISVQVGGEGQFFPAVPNTPQRQLDVMTGDHINTLRFNIILPPELLDTTLTEVRKITATEKPGILHGHYIVTNLELTGLLASPRRTFTW